MKQTSIVIFVSRPAEIESVKKILEEKSGNNPVVISSTPEVSVKLSEHKIDFIDSDVFYPSPQQIKSWHKPLLELCLSWHLLPQIKKMLTVSSVNIGKACELGIHIYLGEIGHSVLTAKNLLSKLRPKLIYVEDKFSESPYRRYHTESLTLEPMALNLLAQQQGIKTSRLSSRLIFHESKIKTITLRLLSSFLFDIRHFSLIPKKRFIADFIFIGNHYQLINLLPTLIAAKKKLKFLVTGRASSDVTDNVRMENIPFYDFNKFLKNPTRFTDTLRFIFYWYAAKPLLKITFSSLSPIIWKLIEPKLWWYFINEFTEIKEIIRSSDNLLSINPKALITMATSDHFSRAIAMTAIKNKVAVIELQHGLYRIDIEYPFRSNNYFLVWSQKEREVLHQGKTHPELYPLASYPWFDQYRNIHAEITDLRKTGRDLFGLNDNDKVIIILATFPKDLDDDRLAVSISPFRYVSMIFKTITKLPGKWKVIFRPHPSCKSEWVKSLASLHGISLAYDDRGSLLKQSLAAADLVIANFTTAIVDAILMDKPIFLHTLIHIHKNHLKNFPSIRSKTANYFETSEELEKLILQSQDLKFETETSGKKYFLNNYVNTTGGQASDQVINFIQKFVKK